MKLSDTPAVDVEVRVDAPPERVWKLATDLTRMGEWSPENMGGEWIDGANGPVVGARFRGKNQHPAVGQWETVAVVTEVDAPHCFAWIVGEPDNPSATWRFDLEPDGDGTRLRQHVTIG